MVDDGSHVKVWEVVTVGDCEPLSLTDVVKVSEAEASFDMVSVGDMLSVIVIEGLKESESETETDGESVRDMVKVGERVAVSSSEGDRVAERGADIVAVPDILYEVEVDSVTDRETDAS